MLFFDFQENTCQGENSGYYQKVREFVASWQGQQTEFELHTSGSTGPPKAIMVQRRQMVASAKLTGQALALGAGTKALCCLNVEHIAGTMMLVRAMELGWQIWVQAPNANPFLHWSSTETIDFTALVPMQLKSILQNEISSNNFLENTGLKQVLIGGAALDNETEEWLQGLRPQFWASYGMTETISHIALRPLNGSNRSPYFKPLPGVSLALDANNRLKIRSESTDNEWILTNDIVELWPDNSFKLLGRSNRVVNSGGIKLYLDSLEHEFTAIFKAFFDQIPVFTLMAGPHELLGEQLLFIGENIDTNKISSILEQSLALHPYQKPKKIININKIPYTQSGKIDYQQLSETIK